MTTKSALHSTLRISTESLIKEANHLVANIGYDKALVAYYWEHCDKARPVSTEDAFYLLNHWKDQLKADRTRLAKVNASIRILKKMIRML